jgi:phage shock protein PspC (stress-responsive transcriptional regulator)
MADAGGAGRDRENPMSSYDGRDPVSSSKPPLSSKPSRKRFARDRAGGKLLGVCAGIANYFGIDPMVVRIAWVVATVFGFGAMVIVYLGIALIAD